MYKPPGLWNVQISNTKGLEIGTSKKRIYKIQAVAFVVDINVKKVIRFYRHCLNKINYNERLDVNWIIVVIHIQDKFDQLELHGCHDSDNDFRIFVIFTYHNYFTPPLVIVNVFISFMLLLRLKCSRLNARLNVRTFSGMSFIVFDCSEQHVV